MIKPTPLPPGSVSFSGTFLDCYVLVQLMAELADGTASWAGLLASANRSGHFIGSTPGQLRTLVKKIRMRWNLVSVFVYQRKVTPAIQNAVALRAGTSEKYAVNAAFERSEKLREAVWSSFLTLMGSPALKAHIATMEALWKHSSTPSVMNPESPLDTSSRRITSPAQEKAKQEEATAKLKSARNERVDAWYDQMKQNEDVLKHRSRFLERLEANLATRDDLDEATALGPYLPYLDPALQASVAASMANRILNRRKATSSSIPVSGAASSDELSYSSFSHVSSSLEKKRPYASITPKATPSNPFETPSLVPSTSATPSSSSSTASQSNVLHSPGSPYSPPPTKSSNSPTSGAILVLKDLPFGLDKQATYLASRFMDFAQMFEAPIASANREQAGRAMVEKVKTAIAKNPTKTLDITVTFEEDIVRLFSLLPLSRIVFSDSTLSEIVVVRFLVAKLVSFLADMGKVNRSLVASLSSLNHILEQTCGVESLVVAAAYFTSSALEDRRRILARFLFACSIAENGQVEGTNFVFAAALLRMHNPEELPASSRVSSFMQQLVKHGVYDFSAAGLDAFCRPLLELNL